jgi:hypothetical protein
MDTTKQPSYYQFLITPDAVDETQAGADPAITYLGFFKGGTYEGDPLSQPLWQIRRVIAENGITLTQYADGNELYNKVWDNRADYNYTFKK